MSGWKMIAALVILAATVIVTLWLTGSVESPHHVASLSTAVCRRWPTNLLSPTGSRGSASSSNNTLPV